MINKSIETENGSSSAYTQSAKALVSIVMPVFNRARFLPQAIESIKAQSFSNWELLIVDDGSTDNSVELLKELTSNIGNPVKILQQENQGPAAARNTGIKQAKGDFFAFFDSDDLWYPHHLKNSLAAFAQHPDLSWVYSACERVEYETGKCLLKSTFYTNGQPNGLFTISEQRVDGTHVLDSKKAILMQLLSGLDNGLQNSVLKREVLEAHLLPDFRVGEDRLFIIMALKSGFKMAFIDAIHVRYHVHGENISDTNKKELDFEKRIRALEQLIASKKSLPNLVQLNSKERQAFKKQLSRELFWELGYSLYQDSGELYKAMKCYLEAIYLYPYTPKYYKTLAGSIIRRFKSWIS